MPLSFEVRPFEFRSRRPLRCALVILLRLDCGQHNRHNPISSSCNPGLWDLDEISNSASDEARGAYANESPLVTVSRSFKSNMVVSYATYN